MPDSVVKALSPRFKRIEIRLLRSSETWENARSSGHTTKLAQYLGLVQSGRGVLDKPTGLLAAHALYRGLLRPRGATARDESIYIYVTCPPASFRLEKDEEKQRWDLREDVRPASSVFAVLADIPDDPDDPRVFEWRKQAGDPDVRGLVLDWEWTQASEKDDTLPEPGRFASRTW